MKIEVVPALDGSAERALRTALESAEVAGRRPDSAWREAALFEGVASEGAEESYAFSPRSTRGATRA